MDFAGKVVLITGASSGIGAASALRFAKASAKLSIVGRNTENLIKVAENCEEENGLKPLSIVADITIEEDVIRIVTETIEHYGKIDVLVNNAGIILMATIQDGVEPLDRIMETNVRGTYMLTQRVIPFIEATKGNIVNVSSVLSTTPLTCVTPYCMSKAALDSFTKCLALELANKGVRVNSVNPGPARTNFFTTAGLSDEHRDALLAGFASSLPLKKICEGEDVAELIVYLASDKASCITGSCIVIDCGINLGKVKTLLYKKTYSRIINFDF
ncbi:3-oxoacyl-[acyl-carrier-protein] reductase FabG-like [Battus philenor]|uniref:3-oxoacyl-[acyl-carrier-protein] reductase FabG-like n=1 Tax=Battus philenor TaxID=42288 RepID=UPI0035D06239